MAIGAPAGCVHDYLFLLVVCIVHLLLSNADLPHNHIQIWSSYQPQAKVLAIICHVTTKRTNEQWLAELQPENPNYETAVSDLNVLLTKGLKRGLLARVKTAAPEFDTQAEDFAQEAVLKILEKIDSFAGRSQFTTWAHKIAISVALTELRRKRWQDSSLDGLTESDGGGAYTPSFVADEAPTPEHRTAQAELLTYVQGLIEHDLTDRQRTALVDSVIQGKTTDQIARKLEMKPNAVYKLLHDARMKLKNRLAQDGYTPGDILQAFD